MNSVMKAAGVLAVVASSATAGGIDRSGQGISIIFEEGSYAELSFGRVNTSVTAGLAGISDATPGYNQLGFGIKRDLSENLSFALIYDQPFGAHVRYTDGPFFPGFAEIESHALTGVLRYNFGNGFSVHGGVRAQQVEGSIASSPGLLTASSDWNFGGLVGVAYEKPEIALRVALTYNSAITNDLDGTHFTGVFNPVSFGVEFPESINLDFQTGINQNTLLFGSIRWVAWDGFNLTTPLGPTEWVSFSENTTTYSLGVGRRFNDMWSGAITLGYEAPGTRPGTTALAPTTGRTSIGIGGTYTNGNMKVTGGVTYIMVGDQTVFGAPFTENDGWGAGVKVGFSF